MAERVAAEIFSPGEYIKEFLEGHGWTQDDLAAILGRPLQLVNEIILDKRGVTPETAKGLAEAFGTSAQLWLNLDAGWQLYKARSTRPDPAIALRARIYSKGPIKEMVKRGWIELSSNPEVLEQRVGLLSDQEPRRSFTHRARCCADVHILRCTHTRSTVLDVPSDASRPGPQRSHSLLLRLALWLGQHDPSHQ